MLEATSVHIRKYRIVKLHGIRWYFSRIIMCLMISCTSLADQRCTAFSMLHASSATLLQISKGTHAYIGSFLFLNSIKTSHCPSILICGNGSEQCSFSTQEGGEAGNNYGSRCWHRRITWNGNKSNHPISSICRDIGVS